MPKNIVFLSVLSVVMAVNAQTINLRGKVFTQGGARPLPNATVTLVSQSNSGTSDSSGSYAINASTGIRRFEQPLPFDNVSLKNGILEVHLTQQQKCKIEVFSMNGTLLRKSLPTNSINGVFRYHVTEKSDATSILVIHVTIGHTRITFRYLPGNNRDIIQLLSQHTTTLNGKTAKRSAVADSLKVTANGHTTKSIPISSYDTTVNIILDSLPGPSIGCGKTLGSLKSGTYTITSAGLNRTYIIEIPKNYNPNTPYRLIFGMHCMCGSMWSVHDENFYELKRCADSANVPCIFVAPSVYNNGNYNQSNWGCPIWDQREKDHTFFEDMLKLFKDTLCVDTTRVFSVGFSYGAMFTNSLAQNHQKQLRAVVCYAASLGGGIYVPTNTKEPIAYMGCVGLSDGRCPPADGRSCRDIMLKNNGLVGTETATETTKGSKTHVIYDYKGVNPKYPVKWCTFDGDHQWAPPDGASSGWDPNRTWTPQVAWQFITQF
jgi:poly(3-hydroxybutyrate) depolymerase